MDNSEQASPQTVGKLEVASNVKINYNPDVLSCLANLSNDEVFTPPELVNQMLDLLPADLWQNKDAKFLDPVTKSGVFLREIAKRLIVGLKDQIPDQQTRINHIFKTQLFGIAITELTSLLARCSVYCSKFANGQYAIAEGFDNPQGNILFSIIKHTWNNQGKCTFCGASQTEYDRDAGLETHAYQFIHTDKPQALFGKDMKFDVIIGNPPYQLESGGFGAQATPIYQLFIEQAMKLKPGFMSFVIPARWYAGGMGLNIFRKNMLNDKRLKVIVDYPNSTECFPGVDIAGGICYFLWDSSYTGDCKFVSIQNNTISESLRPLDTDNVLVRHNGAITILDKVKKQTNHWFSEKVSSINPFGLSTNHSEFDEDGDLIVYGRNRIENRIFTKKIEKNQSILDKYKVMLGQAYGERGSYPYLITGKPFIINPNSCCTATYLVIASTESLEEAQNIKNFLQTKFCRFLISLRKNTQHLHSDRFKFVPIIDWTVNWTDEKLYKKYNLTAEEITFVEAMIRPMELADE